MCAECVPADIYVGLLGAVKPTRIKYVGAPSVPAIIDVGPLGVVQPTGIKYMGTPSCQPPYMWAC